MLGRAPELASPGLVSRRGQQPPLLVGGDHAAGHHLRVEQHAAKLSGLPGRPVRGRQPALAPVLHDRAERLAFEHAARCLLDQRDLLRHELGPIGREAVQPRGSGEPAPRLGGRLACERALDDGGALELSDYLKLLCCRSSCPAPMPEPP